MGPIEVSSKDLHIKAHLHVVLHVITKASESAIVKSRRLIGRNESSENVQKNEIIMDMLSTFFCLT